MPKSNTTIEIVISTNKSLSSMSLISREAAKVVLDKKYHKVQITEVNNLQDLNELVSRKPDLAFLGMKYVPSDPIMSSLTHSKSWLSNQLLESGICYTGSGYAASRLEHNKQLAKHRISNCGLKTAPSQVIRRNGSFTESDITVPYPIFIKPVDGGGGSGINNKSLQTTAVQSSVVKSESTERFIIRILFARPGVQCWHTSPERHRVL
jgi:D-alanine-D-alanine ligase